MMAAAAAAIAPSALITRSSSSSYIDTSKRFLSSSFSITKPILLPSLYLSHSLQPFSAARMTSIRRRFNHSDSFYPGRDYKHWTVTIDRDCVLGANKQQIIDVYVQTLARVLGSVEEAKKKIYKIDCSCYLKLNFGCEIDEDTADRLKGLPGVVYVGRDSYVDPENKDYGGELYVNGEIVQRSPERQMRVQPKIPPSRLRDTPSDDEPDSSFQAQ